VGASPPVLLLDDGELDDVQQLIEQMGIQFGRVRGGAILQDTPPPSTLLVATPRRVRAVRNDGTNGNGAPVRVVVVDEDSPSLREQLRKIGFDYLVRRPVHPEALRLLLLHCVYTGEERRGQPRVPVGFEISFRSGLRRRRAMLTDLSVGGCRLLTPRALKPGKSIKLTLPEELGATAPVTLRGRIARCDFDEKLGDEGLHRSAVVFENVEREARQELEWIVEARARGPLTLPNPNGGGETAEEPPAKTKTGERVRIRSNDPRVEPTAKVGASPVRGRPGGRPSDHRSTRPRDAQVEPAAVERPRPPTAKHVDAEPDAWGGPFDRRRNRRGAYERKIPAFGDSALRVLVGRDLSARGMRVERAELEIGDRVHVAIYGEAGDEPMLVWGTATRKDEEGRVTLLFDELELDIAHALEKLVSRLPAVEPLRDGETAAMGTVMSEIVEP
jgi:hypothetical protein